MTHRQKRLRDRVTFSNELISDLAVQTSKIDESHEERRAVLQMCLEKLSPGVRAVIGLRYSDGISVAEIAGRLNQKANAIAQQLFRARSALIDCANRTLQRQV